METQQSNESITVDAVVTLPSVDVPERNPIDGLRCRQQSKREDILDDAWVLTIFEAVTSLDDPPHKEAAKECPVFEPTLLEEDQHALQRSTSRKPTVGKEENSEDQEFELWREDAKDTEAESLR